MDHKEKINQQLTRIEELTQDYSISKYNLLKISYLIRLIEDSEKFSSECSECRENGKVLAKMVEEIPHLDDIEHRQPYEKQFNEIRKHFHKRHDYIPPYHFISRWSLIGGVFGSALALLISTIAGLKFLYNGLLVGLTLGLLAGYLWGSVKELNYRKMKKII